MHVMLNDNPLTKNKGRDKNVYKPIDWETQTQNPVAEKLYLILHNYLFTGITFSLDAVVTFFALTFLIMNFS